MKLFTLISEVNEKLANPAPLGLLGFGMTTVLLNLHNAGFYPLNSMILAMGLAYGGLAQSVFYLALAEVLNEIYGKTLLPV